MADKCKCGHDKNKHSYYGQDILHRKCIRCSCENFEVANSCDKELEDLLREMVTDALGGFDVNYSDYIKQIKNLIK